MPNVVIYRKDVPGAKPRLKKAEMERATALVEMTSRVKRPSLLAFLADPKGFYGLPALAPKVIDNKAIRIIDHGHAGWVVPADSLGRSGTADRSQAESIKLWIGKNAAHLVNIDHVSVVIE